MLVFSVFDEKAQVYSTPVFLPHKGLAVREFSDVVKDKNSALAKHPSDYKLCLLGEFDNVSGGFLACPQPEFVCSAIEFVDTV